MPELWCRAAGFPAYEISTSGRCRQIHTKRLCGIWLDSYGYPTLSLQVAGEWKKTAVHLLVFRTFRGPTRRGYEIDHRNRCKSDARLTNLQQITIAQNRQRALYHRGRSQYRGVYFNCALGRWRAQVGFLGRNQHVGYFRSERAAAKARDHAARKLHGRWAVLNFGGRRA